MKESNFCRSEQNTILRHLRLALLFSAKSQIVESLTHIYNQPHFSISAIHTRNYTMTISQHTIKLKEKKIAKLKLSGKLKRGREKNSTALFNVRMTCTRREKWVDYCEASFLLYIPIYSLLIQHVLHVIHSSGVPTTVNKYINSIHTLHAQAYQRRITIGGWLISYTRTAHTHYTHIQVHAYDVYLYNGQCLHDVNINQILSRCRISVLCMYVCIIGGYV